MPKNHQELFDHYYSRLQAEQICKGGPSAVSEMDKIISWAETYAKQNNLKFGRVK